MTITTTVDSKELQIELRKALKPLIEELKDLSKQVENLANGDTKKLVTVKEFAKLVGRSEKTIRNMINEGKISYDQPGEGRKIMIPYTEVYKFRQL